MPAGALRRGAQRVGAYIANKGSIGISNGFEHAGTGRIGGLVPFSWNWQHGGFRH